MIIIAHRCTIGYGSWDAYNNPIHAGFCQPIAPGCGPSTIAVPILGSYRAACGVSLSIAYCSERVPINNAIQIVRD